MPAQVALAASDLVADKYLLERKIGEGTMGVVFLARHVVSGKQVALKLLRGSAQDPTAIHRLRREASAAARVRHPHVVDVYDLGTYSGGLYLVMELLEGETLSDRLKRGRLTIEEAMTTLLPVMRAVASAHKAGVVHRDLKPANIFLSRHEDEPVVAKVLDFGVSRIYQGGEQGEDWTTDSSTVGTPLYMAPEQFLDARSSDHRADIYSLGVILYEALSGERPFKAKSRDALVVKVATESPRPLLMCGAHVPPRLVEIVMRSIARNPDDRYSDMPAFLAELEGMQLGDTEGTGDELSVQRRPRLTLHTGAALLVLALVVAALWPAKAPSEPASVTEAAVLVAPPADAAGPSTVPTPQVIRRKAAEQEARASAAKRGEADSKDNIVPTGRSLMNGRSRNARRNRRRSAATASPGVPARDHVLPPTPHQPANEIVELRLEEF